jgi:nucleotide-binding universal stress UspA family protein
MFKRILVPIDGSDLSVRAIEASIALARSLGSTVVGFVAEPLAPLPATAATRTLLQQEQLEHDALTEAHARPILARFASAAQMAGVPFEGHYDQVPAIDRAIVTAAESHHCDLIVMVTHGRGAFGEFLFGSHTKAVLAGCKLPLLVLH